MGENSREILFQDLSLVETESAPALAAFAFCRDCDSLSLGESGSFNCSAISTSVNAGEKDSYLWETGVICIRPAEKNIENAHCTRIMCGFEALARTHHKNVKETTR